MQKLVKLTFAVLILVVVILAAPFGMGFLAEKEAHKKIKEVQLKLEQNPNIEYKLLSYKRGFFKSKAEEYILVKHLKIGDKEMGPIEITLVDEIKHGPIVLSKDATGKLDLWIGRAVVKGRLKEVKNVAVQPLPMDIYTGYMGFKGDIKLAVDIKKLSLDFPIFMLSLEGLQDEFKIAHDHNNIDNQFTLKHIGLTNKIKPQRIDINGLSVITEMKQDDKGLWLGNRKVEIESLAAAIDGKNYAVKGVYNKTTDLEHDKQIKSEVVLNVQSAGVDNRLYGPHYLTLEIDGMDASILSRLNQAVIKLGHGNLKMQNGPAQAPEVMKNQAIMNKIGDLAADLIKKGFLIEVKRLEIATNWGSLVANSRFKIPNLSEQTQQIPQLSLLTSILSMDSTVQAKIPVGMVKAMVESRYRRMLEAQNLPMQPPAMQNVGELADKHLAKLVADGWFIPKGKDYEISLSFKKGEFLVNDKPLKPQGILPELAAPPASQEIQLQNGEDHRIAPDTLDIKKPVQPNVPSGAPGIQSPNMENLGKTEPQVSNKGIKAPQDINNSNDINPSSLSKTMEDAQSDAQKVNVQSEVDKTVQPATSSSPVEPVVKNPIAPATPIPSNPPAQAEMEKQLPIH